VRSQRHHVIGFGRNAASRQPHQWMTRSRGSARPALASARRVSQCSRLRLAIGYELNKLACGVHLGDTVAHLTIAHEVHPMPDPISRIALVRDELTKTFGADYIEQHPEIVVAALQTAASDYACHRIAPRSN
jgi:hypothetical protein